MKLSAPRSISLETGWRGLRDSPAPEFGRASKEKSAGCRIRRANSRSSALASFSFLVAAVLVAEPVAVRHTEGLVRGFLVLRTLDGKAFADGELVQFAHGDRVTSRLIFRFKDGSVHDETAVFTQRRTFRLLSDHLIQKGPSFPQPVEVTIDATSGRVTLGYREPDGKAQVKEEKLQLPDDVANGSVLTLVKNLRPEAPETTVSMVAATTKPVLLVKLVKLAISRGDRERFSIGRISYKATRYVVKIEIGGLTGILASLLGKKPTDTSVWVLEGDAPAFVKSEGALYFGGPVWRIELASPVWPETSPPGHPSVRPLR